MEAVKQNGKALKYTSDRLRDDKEIVIEAVKQAGGIVVGIGVLLDRAEQKKDLGAPLFSCLQVTTTTYAPAECPLCAAGNRPNRESFGVIRYQTTRLVFSVSLARQCPIRYNRPLWKRKETGVKQI